MCLIILAGCVEESTTPTNKSQPPINKPATKQVCEMIKNKQGQLVEQCKTIKIYQKYEGTPVNPQQNTR